MLQIEAFTAVRSMTRANYRNIMLTQIEDVKLEDASSLNYHSFDKDEARKPLAIKEITNVKTKVL